MTQLSVEISGHYLMWTFVSISYNLGIPLLDMYPRETLEYINLETHTRMLIKAKELEVAGVYQQQQKNRKTNCGIFIIFNL